MSKHTKTNIQEVIDSDYHAYAMYVLEHRAIPSCIDGLKPTSRKLVYAMINEHKGKKTKISDLGGISKFNYHHGESSAMGGAITLAASYKNNVPVFEQDGNFGSRLIQEAAAPRYIYASLGEDFYRYFQDFEVCDKNSDPDNPEPQTYLPLIPWVLVNGIEGIAVGFACNFLPHNPKHLAKACIQYLSGKKISPLIPTFPSFNGRVYQDDPGLIGKYLIEGSVERVKRNTWDITEVPYGYDREKYFNLLSTMEDKNLIQDFEDKCDKSGFRFLVKLNTEQDEKCAEDPITYFKLRKSETENYTTLDEFGKLKLFENKEQIVSYFCDYRLKKVREKIDYDIFKLETEITWLTTKSAFIRDVTGEKLKIKSKKKAEWLIDLPIRYSTSREDSEKLLGIAVVDMTEDYIEALENKIETKKKELSVLLSLDAKQVYLDKLKALA